ncbi:MAG: trigger factor [Clostridia bacterium]|nr:trigger factor [Clostridia bacterium]
MGFKNAEKKETNVYVISFQIDKADFDAANDRAFRKNGKNITIPGFRKGKAPRHLIERMYGKGVFYDEAINDCLPAAYEDALKASGLDVIGQPEFDVTSIDESGVAMTAKVTTKPEASIKNYKGIKVTKDVKAVTAADVKAEIESVRARNSREIEITDRAAKKDDIANIDFEGFVDGVAFDGGKAEGHTLKLGSGAFIPGFEEQIIGKKVGESFDVNVTFPTDYHASELAGKPALFKVKLNSLKVSELPALDDEFVKDVSEFDTLDEYKADVKAKITERNEKEADGKVDEQLTDALISLLEAEIPEVMFDIEADNFVRDYENRLRMQGLDLNTYFKYTGQTIDALRAQMRPQAEKQVRMRLALEAIAKAEKLTATDEELEAEYKKIADNYHMDVESVKAAVSKEDLATDIVVKKAFDFVKDNASVTKKSAKKADDDADATAEKKAPAKKAAAKKETEAKEPAKKPAAKKATAKSDAPAEKKSTAKKTTKKTETK